MKHKLSVSLDESLVQELDRILSTGKYRNKSHAVEFAVRKLLDSASSTDNFLQPTYMSASVLARKSPQIHPEVKNG